MTLASFIPPHPINKGATQNTKASSATRRACVCSPVCEFLDRVFSHNVEFKAVRGAPPDLLLLDKEGEEIRRIDLGRFDREGCNKLLLDLGFWKKLMVSEPHCEWSGATWMVEACESRVAASEWRYLEKHICLVRGVHEMRKAKAAKRVLQEKDRTTKN